MRVVIKMEVKYKYVWDVGGSGSKSSDSESVGTVNIKSDIAHMVTKGCHTKALKSKMKKLGSLNAAML